MKSNFLKSIICLVGVGMLTYSCSTETEKLPVDFDAVNVSGGAFASELSTEGSTDINKSDPGSSTFSKTYQMVDPKGGADISKIELFVSFSGLSATADEVLYQTVTSDDFANVGNGYPEATISVDGESLLSAMSLTPAQLEGGDSFNYRIAVTNSDGTFSAVSNNFSNQSADHNFSSTVICIPPFAPPGDYIINMQDSFKDGWQTNDGSGGDGLTCTLSNGVVFEVGLCNPYVAVAYDCVDDYSAGSATITIPAGIESAEWFFPGDTYGEISFNIIGPSGTVIFDSPQGANAGGAVLSVNLCNE